MAENPQLGVAGAPFREGSYQYDYRFQNIQNVWGGCQMFRRECFESIGGYVPLRGGCIDHVAVLSARMKGWQTRTFTEKICLHHRQMGTALQGGLKAKFKFGVKDYSLAIIRLGIHHRFMGQHVGDRFFPERPRSLRRTGALERPGHARCGVGGLGAEPSSDTAVARGAVHAHFPLVASRLAASFHRLRPAAPRRFPR